jgi:protein tyrosine kinase modulator
LVLVAEFADKAIRRSSDVFALVDSQLVVSIPYITTTAELRRRRRRILLIIVVAAAIIIGAMIAAYLLLPLDLMIAKARVGLFR